MTRAHGSWALRVMSSCPKLVLPILRKVWLRSIYLLLNTSSSFVLNTMTRSQLSFSVSLYWRAGCDGKEESEGESLPPFSLPITPCFRRARYAKTTEDESVKCWIIRFSASWSSIRIWSEEHSSTKWQQNYGHGQALIFILIQFVTVCLIVIIIFFMGQITGSKQIPGYIHGKEYFRIVKSVC